MSSRIIVIPITSNVATLYPFEAEVYVDKKKAKAMVDQIRTIDKSRLKEYICKITDKEIMNLEKAIKLVLSLD